MKIWTGGEDSKAGGSGTSAWLSDRAAVRWLAVLVAYAAVRSVIAAVTKPFWYDEICTQLVALQPSIRALWSALGNAADAQGPAYYLVERAISPVLSNQEVALRIPSIFGFCCITICVFILVRRRAGSTYALICSLIPFTTVLFETYAVEARAYSLVVACVAAALVCYQRASSWRWLGLMALCLALGQSLHYYAVFALLPIGLAEAVRFLRTRENRIGVWAALLIGVTPLVVFWPLLARFREHYGAHYYAQPSLFTVTVTYGTFFDAAARWGVAVAGVLALGVLCAAVPPLAVKSESTSESADIFGEQVLTLGLLGLPFAGYVVTKIAHGGLTSRYVIPMLLGVPLALGYILPRVGRRSVALLAGFLLFVVFAREEQFWLSHDGHLTNEGKLVAGSIERLSGAAGHEDLPVVVSDGVEFVALVHYADPYWQNRFVCLVDPEEAVAYTRTDLLDKELVVLATLAPMHVYRFPAFANRYPAFLLYSDDGRESGGPVDVFDWWPLRLARDGYSVDLLTGGGTRKVFLVSRGKNSR